MMPTSVQMGWQEQRQRGSGILPLKVLNNLSLHEWCIVYEHHPPNVVSDELSLIVCRLKLEDQSVQRLERGESQPALTQKASAHNCS